MREDRMTEGQEAVLKALLGGESLTAAEIAERTGMAQGAVSASINCMSARIPIYEDGKRYSILPEWSQLQKMRERYGIEAETGTKEEKPASRFQFKKREPPLKAVEEEKVEAQAEKLYPGKVLEEGEEMASIPLNALLELLGSRAKLFLKIYGIEKDAGKALAILDIVDGARPAAKEKCTRLEAILKEKGIKQIDIVRAAKYSRASVSNWVRGLDDFPAAAAEKVAEMAGISAAEVISASREPAEEKWTA